MKKITFIAFLLITALGNAQTLQGTWKINPQAGALGVGPNQGDIGWWSNSIADVATRACLFDDLYVFNSDGSFNNVQGTQTWLEAWQGSADVCGTPVAPHNGSNAATWSVDTAANTVTLTGVGAYLGLAKATNSGELSTPSAAPASVTYKITSITANLVTLDINFGGGWWRFVMQKQGVVPTCTDGLQNGDETGIDCGGSCPTTCLTQINLPVTFESSTVNYAVTDFGGNVSTKVVDPTNATNTVMKVVKTNVAAGWAGTTISTDSGFSSPVPFTSTSKKMNIKVWSPNAGITVRLKVEDHLNVNHYVEKDVTTTTVGWQTLEFDFTNPTTAAFDSTFIYDKASIFFNFLIDGTTAGEQTYYFDDVFFGAALSNNQFNLVSYVKVYPNPSNSIVTITGTETIDSVSIMNLLGQEVMTKNNNMQSAVLDISSLQNGVYLIKTTIAGKISTDRFIKN